MNGYGFNDYYDQGLAVMMYDISHDVMRYRFRDEDFKIPAGSVPFEIIAGMRFAKIEDVRKVAM